MISYSFCPIYYATRHKYEIESVIHSAVRETAIIICMCRLRVIFAEIPVVVPFTHLVYRVVECHWHIRWVDKVLERWFRRRIYVEVATDNEIIIISLSYKIVHQLLYFGTPVGSIIGTCLQVSNGNLESVVRSQMLQLIDIYFAYVGIYFRLCNKFELCLVVEKCIVKICISRSRGCRPACNPINIQRIAKDIRNRICQSWIFATNLAAAKNVGLLIGYNSRQIASLGFVRIVFGSAITRIIIEIK